MNTTKQNNNLTNTTRTTNTHTHTQNKQTERIGRSQETERRNCRARKRGI